MNNNLKSSSTDLVPKGFVRPKQNFYSSIVSFFSPVFTNISKEDNERLQIISNTYLQALILLDRFIDDGHDKFIFIQGVDNLEKAIKQLSYFFSDKHPFWDELKECKTKFYKAMLLEEKLNSKKTVFTEELFLDLAISKSAICYGLLNAMKFLNHSNIFSQQLTFCLESIHIAFQYQDKDGNFINYSVFRVHNDYISADNAGKKSGKYLNHTIRNKGNPSKNFMQNYHNNVAINISHS